MIRKMALFLAALIAALALGAAPAMAESADEPVEWTVMFYFCGSDLESRHSYATGNLGEIMECTSYAKIHDLILGEEAIDAPDTTPEGVNVVIETGGCSEWHAQDIGMDVAADRLQRWHYHISDEKSFVAPNSFELDDEQPLASMADPQTLADFIRWSAEKYPAKKYALVLWDHGLGGKEGIFIDELFDGDTMCLDELHEALADGGVTFEAVVFDACLMANLETACAVKDSARWMVASEEVVAGKGTAMYDWLQQLYLTPQWDGERLGRWICDMTQVKYANEADAQAQSTLTWAVIDLSKIDRVAELFDRFFEAVGRFYAEKPVEMMIDAMTLSSAFEFGLGGDGMIDLSILWHDRYFAGQLDRDLYDDMLNAIESAVVYSTRGSGRAGARGLSFFYAAPFTPDVLDTYARNCPSAHYLALLDAINPAWTAPDWVYERAERLPEIQDMEDYIIRVEKIVISDGVPGVRILSGDASIKEVRADLYRLNEQTGQRARLGSTTASIADLDVDNITIDYALDNFWMWPAIEGVHCDAELLVPWSIMNGSLYSIPVQIGADNYQMRLGYDQYAEEEPLTIFGLWEGYDADSSVFNRNVTSLSKLAGQDYCLLYPLDGADGAGNAGYETSETMTMYRSLEINPEPLEPGTYYLDYWIKDIFKRSLPIGRVEVYWDGEAVSVTDGAWQGEMALTLPET